MAEEVPGGLGLDEIRLAIGEPPALVRRLAMELETEGLVKLESVDDKTKVKPTKTAIELAAEIEEEKDKSTKNND